MFYVSIKHILQNIFSYKYVAWSPCFGTPKMLLYTLGGGDVQTYVTVTIMDSLLNNIIHFCSKYDILFFSNLTSSPLSMIYTLIILVVAVHMSKCWFGGMAPYSLQSTGNTDLNVGINKDRWCE